MLFHEIYGCYFECVSEIIKEAILGELDENKMYQIVKDSSFKESFLTIIPALQEEKWQLINSSYQTPIKHIPSMPLTQLERQWLKAISLDPKIKLFQLDFSFLDDEDPLFTADDFVIFDQYNDGDPYEDEQYINIFQTLLKAIHTKKYVQVHYLSQKGNEMDIRCVPYKIEYSFKDDKFRVLIEGCHWAKTLNIAGIKQCTLMNETSQYHKTLKKTKYIILELIDERNALERAMLHFAHFQKEAISLDHQKYQLKLYYDENDETELVIRVLSFGPFIKVTYPTSFIKLIQERLIRQKSCGLH